MDAKPPYRVPSMAEVAALTPNGLTVASTFSGCGGSSLGYRMAGYRVLWANEFVPAARDTYRANAAPYTHLNEQDIRTITPGMLLDQAGVGAGELDILDGSPPCASFSTAGKRQAGWGKSKKYSDTEQRTDDLFSEYARLLRGVQPRVFVAENVSGLVKGAAKGYFLRILAELRDCGYQVTAKLLDAQWLGVPQARQRLIFIGVRDDLGQQPVHPSPLPYRYSVADALPQLLAQGDNGSFGEGAMRATTVPSPTIGSDPSSGNGRFPPSAVIASGAYRVITKPGQGEGEPCIYDGDFPSPTITAAGIGPANGNREVAIESPDALSVDPETGKDLSIERYAIGREWERLRQGEPSDRYFQLSRPSESSPSPTVTARGGSVDAASVTHPVVARKFTLRELRRICGFPDDFILTGTYEQRWERLGRAVPPVMMAAVAATIRDHILIPVERAMT
jgi:DNA (cytosine-5)-methyltransferase 1